MFNKYTQQGYNSVCLLNSFLYFALKNLVLQIVTKIIEKIQKYFVKKRSNNTIICNRDYVEQYEKKYMHTIMVFVSCDKPIDLRGNLQ